MKKILVIEDSAAMREEIVETLLIENFEAVGAPDGIIGIQLAREVMPDLIICDIMMPEMDGYEVLEELRRDSTTALIPFIFLTALSTRSDIRKGMELGADDFISKPFTTYELLNSIATRLEKQTNLENQRLRMQASQLVKTQELERHRMAAELHDEVGQALNSVKFLLGMLRRLPQEESKYKLMEAQALVNEIIQRVGEMSIELRPLVLDDLGLLPTLLQLFKRYTGQTNVRVNFHHMDIDRRFQPEIETSVYRIVQEALTNTARHTSVNQVSVRIWLDNDLLYVTIEDTGEGFDLATVAGMGSGLVGMRERAVALNGSLSIFSAPAQGTQLIAKIPVVTETQPKEPKFSFAMIPSDNGRSSKDAEISVVIAEQHELLREGIKSAFKGNERLCIKGEANGVRQTLELVEQHKPAVLILDHNFGLDAIENVTHLSPETHILLFSHYSDEAYVLEALRKGADGYIFKDAGAEELVQAVFEAAAGKRYLSQTLSERVLEFYVSVQRAEDNSLSAIHTLTEREREIFRLAAQGRKNPDIADILVISPRTVETHRANFMRKLGLHSQTDLVRYATQHRIIPSD